MLFDNKYTKDLAVSYYQVIPWFMKLYYHTLKIKQNGLPIDQEKCKWWSETDQWETDIDLVFTYMRIEPSEDRKSPAIMEFEFVLPANSTTFITIDFDKCFLHYTEHPPDANRGFDISSAVLTINYERSAIAGNYICKKMGQSDQIRSNRLFRTRPRDPRFALQPRLGMVSTLIWYLTTWEAFISPEKHIIADVHWRAITVTSHTWLQ